MSPRTLLACLLLSSCAWAYGQGQWGIFAGPQVAHVGFNAADPEGYQDPHERIAVSMDGGNGWGMHLGSSFRSNSDTIAFKLSWILSVQRYAAEYTRQNSYHGLGGSYNQARTGTLNDKLIILEFPLQCSIRIHDHFLFDVGLSPWLLLAAERREHGILTTSSRTMSGGLTRSISTYDELSRSVSPYHLFGVSGDACLTAAIRHHWTLGLSTSIGLLPIYQDQTAFYGHHLVLRASIGYQLHI